ncbi:MAG: hypothetical protein J6Z12_05395 [Paludibacteraceae bacterium]|nr:hypothetical protein [Paludibacteraceae bacterium]
MKHLIPLLLLLTALTACHRRELGYDLPDGDARRILFAPIPYQTGLLYLRISDYLGPDHGVTRVESTSKWIVPTLLEDGDLVSLAISKKRPYEADLLLWQGTVCYAVPMHRTGWYDTRLYLPDDTFPVKTYLISDVNGWNPYFYPEFSPAVQGGSELMLSAQEGHYRAALWQADGHRFIVDSLPIVYSEQGTPSNVIYCGPMHFSVPILNLDRQEGSVIYCHAEKEVGRIVAYWNNHLLPGRLCKLQRGGTIAVELPAAADSTEGFLRILAVNDLGQSNDLLVPIRQGKAGLPGQPANYHCADTLRYLGGNRTDLISQLTATALDRHGSHRLAMRRLPSDTTSAEYAWQLTGPSSPALTAGSTALERLHNRSCALQYGDFMEWDVQEHYWIYERRFFNESVLVVINTSDEDVMLNLAPTGRWAEAPYRTLSGHPADFSEPIEVAAGGYTVFFSE